MTSRGDSAPVLQNMSAPPRATITVGTLTPALVGARTIKSSAAGGAPSRGDGLRAAASASPEGVACRLLKRPARGAGAPPLSAEVELVTGVLVARFALGTLTRGFRKEDEALRALDAEALTDQLRGLLEALGPPDDRLPALAMVRRRSEPAIPPSDEGLAAIASQAMRIAARITGSTFVRSAAPSAAAVPSGTLELWIPY
jgi:hypothetical protein